MEKDHPIATLDGVKIGDYVLHVTRLQQMKLSGWKFFAIGLSTTVMAQVDLPAKEVGQNGAEEQCSMASALPVLEGIYSRGGKGVAPWMEILTYHNQVELEDKSGVRLTVDLSAAGLDRTLFEQLGKLIPPGGHIMVWYESKQDAKTYLALQKGVPPLVTELGRLLFWAGCLSVRDFSLPEGGLEGCRKLWGERPVNKRHEQMLKRSITTQLRDFLSRDWAFSEPAVESDMKVWASGILSELKT